MEHEHIPYIVYESEMARAERHARRLTWALIAAVIVFAASNLAWMMAVIH